MSEAEDWAVIVRAKNQEIQKWQQQALELSNLVMPLRDEVARLRGALQPFAERWEYFERTKHPSGTWPDDMEYADDEPSAIYLGQLKAAKEALAALTPQAGKGGANG